MKKAFIISALIFLSYQCFAQVDIKADSLLNNKQYFKLNSYLNEQKQLNKFQKLYYGAFMKNFFNKAEESSKDTQALLKNYKNQLQIKDVIEIIKLQIDNDLKLYNYKSAYANSALLLKDYKNNLDTADTKDIGNSIIIWKSLQNIRPQTTTVNQDTRILYKRDLAKLMTAPVQFENYKDDYVFDTGANISVITETNAKKANLTLMNNVFEVAAITGIKVKAHAGVAAQLKLGNITVNNVVFLVFPDSVLSFANGQYKIQGIIGFPVIEQLGQIRLNKQGYMDIAASPSPAAIGNLGLDGLTPVINVKYQDTMHPFTFDTGAQVSFFNKPFYLSYQKAIELMGSSQDMRIGGAGGTSNIKSFKIPEVTLAINGKLATLTNASVKTVAVGEKDKSYFGNLGQDVISQFDEILINFKYMYVDLIKN